MRTPGVAGRHSEDARAVLHFDARAFAANTVSRNHGRLGRVQHQLADQSPVMQDNLLFSQQALECKLWRVARSGGTDVAGPAADTHGSPVIFHRVLGLRHALKRNPRLLAPGFKLLQAVCERHGRHGIWLRTPVFGKRTRLPRNAESPLRFAVELLEFGPLNRPVDIQTVHRLQAQIFFGESIASSAPVQGLAADRHGSGDSTLGGLVFDKVARPGILAVPDYLSRYFIRFSESKIERPASTIWIDSPGRNSVSF